MGQKPHSMGQAVPPLVQQAAERLLEGHLAEHYRQAVVAHMHTPAEAGLVEGLHSLQVGIAVEEVPARAVIAEAATSSKAMVGIAC